MNKSVNIINLFIDSSHNNHLIDTTTSKHYYILNYDKKYLNKESCNIKDRSVLCICSLNYAFIIDNRLDKTKQLPLNRNIINNNDLETLKPLLRILYPNEWFIDKFYNCTKKYNTSNPIYIGKIKKRNDLKIKCDACIFSINPIVKFCDLEITKYDYPPISPFIININKP